MDIIESKTIKRTTLGDWILEVGKDNIEGQVFGEIVIPLEEDSDEKVYWYLCIARSTLCNILDDVVNNCNLDEDDNTVMAVELSTGNLCLFDNDCKVIIPRSAKLNIVK